MRPPIKIIAVDDDEGALFVLEMILVDAGYDVSAISDPRQALSLLRETSFDLMITDRTMPGFTGDELSLAVKAHFPSLPILMLTGTGHAMNAEARIPYGVDQVLGKPVLRATLLDAVRKLIA